MYYLVFRMDFENALFRTGMAIWKLDVKSVIVTTRDLHQSDVTESQANADAKKVSQDCGVMCVRKATLTSLTSVSKPNAYGFMGNYFHFTFSQIYHLHPKMN